MINILKSLGLENEVVVSDEAIEFQSDMIGMENYLDLQSSLESTGLQISMESVEEVQLAIAMGANDSHNKVDVLNSVGFESMEIGTEAVVDIAARQWYKAKAAIKGLIRMFINFCKKILSLGNVTDKAFKAIKTKHKAYDKKWSANAGKIKLDSDKEYKTKISDIEKVLSSSGTGAEKDQALKIQKIVTLLNNTTTVKELVTSFSKAAGNSDGIDEVIKLGGNSTIKEVKEAASEKLKDISDSDLSATEYKIVTKKALDAVGDTAKRAENAKISKSLDKAIKNLQKIENNVGKLKAEDRDDIFKADGSFDAFLVRISKLSEGIMTIPVVYSIKIKSEISLCQKVFTEVDRILAY